VDPLRLDALELGEPLAVEAQLQHVRGLRVPSELRVERLVRPCAEGRRRLDSDEEVGEPAPPVARQRGLVDDVGARPHRRERLIAGLRPVAVELDRRHAKPVRAEPLEVRLLVLQPLAEHELCLLAGRRRLGQVSQRDLERLRGEVLAGEVGRHVGRREPDTPVDQLHRGSIDAAAGAAYAGTSSSAPASGGRRPAATQRRR
jgi:hypothetical protein